MGDRLIFLYRLNPIKTQRRGGEGQASRLLVPGERAYEDCPGKSGWLTPKLETSPSVGEVAASMLYIKAPLGGFSRPYRKPTQVDGTSILRRSGELSLRNSAI